MNLNAHKLTLLTCLFLAVEAAAAQTVNFTARKSVNRAYDNLVKQATQALDNGDYLNAINLWTKTISDFPSKSEPYLQRAVVRRQIGDLKGAQLDLDKALELSPNLAPALIQRAAVRHRLLDMKGAQADIERAVELAPNNYQAYAERGSIRYAVGDLQGALADYNTAMTINPEMGKRLNKAVQPQVGQNWQTGQSWQTGQNQQTAPGQPTAPIQQAETNQAAPGNQAGAQSQASLLQNQLPPGVTVQTTTPGQLSIAGPKLQASFQLANSSALGLKELFARVPVPNSNNSGAVPSSGAAAAAGANSGNSGAANGSSANNGGTNTGGATTGSTSTGSSSTGGTTTGGTTTGGTNTSGTTTGGTNSSSTIVGSSTGGATNSSGTNTGGTSAGSSSTGGSTNGGSIANSSSGGYGTNSAAQNASAQTTAANATATGSNEAELPTYSASQLAHLNNLAANAINNKQFDKAIDILERLVKASPDYAHARDNLVIAHNNLGLLQAARKPEQAVSEFRAALFIDSSKTATRKNLNAVLSELGKEPNNHQERRKLAETLIARGDWQGAYVEITEALRLNNNRESRLLLAKVITSMEGASPAVPVRVSTRAAKPRRTAAEIAAAAAARASEPPLQSPSAGPAFYPAGLAAPREVSTREAISREALPKEASSKEPSSKETLVREASLKGATARDSAETAAPANSAAGTATNTAAAGRAANIAAAPGTATNATAPPQGQPASPGNNPEALASHTPDTVSQQADAFRQEPPEATVPHVKAFDQDFMTERINSSPEDVLMVARQFATEGNYLDAEALLIKLVENQSTNTSSSRKTDLLEVALESLISIYIKLNKPDRAEQHLKVLLQLQETSKHPHDPQLGKTMADYARVLRLNGKQDEAAKHQAKADSILDRLSGTAP